MFIAMRKINLLRLLPLASLVLAACTTTQQTSGPATSPDSPEWRAHQQQVQQITHYQTRGSFAYLSDTKKVYARFFWQQYAANRYRLLLTNPIGGTEMDLRVTPEEVLVTDNQGKQHRSDDANAMISALTGMSIPLDSLRQWILGIPGDASDFRLDDRYRLKQVTYKQDGQTWNVEYQAYSDSVQPTLPERLELQQGEQRIKLKMDNWDLK